LICEPIFSQSAVLTVYVKVKKKEVKVWWEKPEVAWLKLNVEANFVKEEKKGFWGAVLKSDYGNAILSPCGAVLKSDSGNAILIAHIPKLLIL
jgi:hypothetical protein